MIQRDLFLSSTENGTSIYFLAKNFNEQVHCHATAKTLILRLSRYCRCNYNIYTNIRVTSFNPQDSQGAP